MIHVVIWLIIFAIYYFYHVYKASVEEKEAEEEQFFHDLMNDEQNKEDDISIAELVLTTLRKIGCTPETEKRNSLNYAYFTYQGEKFTIESNDKCFFITIYDTWWHSISIYSDVEDIANLHKTINMVNQYVNCTLVYTTNKEIEEIGVHSKRTVLFVKEIPEIDKYLLCILNDFFKAQRLAMTELEKCKVIENKIKKNMRKKVYIIGMIVLVLIVIAEGFVIYNLYAFIKKEENMYAHYEKEYIKRLSDELKLERKGLRHDTRGGDFCPACDSKDVAEIRYGLYDSKNDVWKEEIESGKVVLGGCMVGEDSKRFYCNDCGYKWGALELNEAQ